MAILSFVGALAALLVAAVVLNFVSQSLEGRETYFLHFGLVALIVVVGGALFPFWGWTSTGWVLGGATLLSAGSPLCQRLFGDEKPAGYLWHGDDPGTHEGGPDRLEPGPDEVFVSPMSDDPTDAQVRALLGAVIRPMAGRFTPDRGWLDWRWFARVLRVTPAGDDPPACPRCGRSPRFRLEVEWEPRGEATPADLRLDPEGPRLTRPFDPVLCEACVGDVVRDGAEKIPFGDALPRELSIVSVHWEE